MKRTLLLLAVAIASSSQAEVPSNLVVENVPEPPPAMVEKVRPYLDFRAAMFAD